MSTQRAVWLSVDRAAAMLDVSPEALAKRLARAARKAPDGVVEASVDGVTGRKFGRVWRVHLSERWAAPS
jgi:hypothetical protein